MHVGDIARRKRSKPLHAVSARARGVVVTATIDTSVLYAALHEQRGKNQTERAALAEKGKRNIEKRKYATVLPSSIHRHRSLHPLFLLPIPTIHGDIYIYIYIYTVENVAYIE